MKSQASYYYAGRLKLPAKKLKGGYLLRTPTLRYNFLRYTCKKMFWLVLWGPWTFWDCFYNCVYVWFYSYFYIGIVAYFWRNKKCQMCGTFFLLNTVFMTFILL